MIEKSEANSGSRIKSAEGLTKLCDWATSKARSDLTDGILRLASIVIADDIAAIVAAASDKRVTSGHIKLLRSSGRAEATILTDERLMASREQAAAANGLAVAWAELDEGYRQLPCHAGAYVLPTLMAEAEAIGACVGEVLEAMAIAYEITARIARSYPFPRISVHPHGAFSPIGAAAGLAVLRRYDTSQLRAAVSAAATMSMAGPFNHAIEGALIRNAWTSIGAIAGFQAADFAPLGIEGLPTSLDDVFVKGFGCLSKPEELIVNLGRDWAIENGFHKIYACCQFLHSSVEAALDNASKAQEKSLGAPVQIEVETHNGALALSVRQPLTTLAAKFSLPHVMAAVALTGSAGAEAFNESSLTAPDFIRLRENVVMSPLDRIGEWPLDRPSRVHWSFQNGARLTSKCLSARGGPDRPFSDAELYQKFGRLTERVFPAAGNVLQEFVENSSTHSGERWSDIVNRLTAMQIAS